MTREQLEKRIKYLEEVIIRPYENKATRKEAEKKLEFLETLYDALYNY